MFNIANTKKRIPTMLEINDAGRESEYSVCGDNYKKAMLSFLESLGYEVTLRHEGHYGLGVVIDGVEFMMGDDNASYMTENIYSRKRYVRAAHNRYMSLSCPGSKNMNIQINKEYDANDIRKRITKMMEANQARERGIEDNKNERDRNVMQIGRHYLTRPTIKKAVDHIYIDKTIIQFSFINKVFQLKVDMTNNAWVASFNMDDIKTKEDMNIFVKNASNYAHQLQRLVESITAVDILPEWLTRYAAEKIRHGYFYTKTMTVDKE